MGTQRALLVLLLALLAAAPLAFGSIQPWPRSCLAAGCLVAGALWVLWRRSRGLASLPWRDPILWAGILFALFGAAQATPIPRSALARLSANALEMRDRYEPGAWAETSAGSDATADAATSKGWRPASLYPWATRRSTLWFLACLVALLAIVDLAAFEPARRAILYTLAGSGAFQAVYGLAEYFSGHQHIFGYAKKYYTEVATGTFINRNHFAGYLEMTLPLMVALAATAMMRPRGSGADDRSRRTFRAAVFLILALTMATALVCSRSRMGIASMTVAMLGVGVLLISRGRGRGYAAAALIVAGATVLVFSQGGAASALLDRFAQVFVEFRGDLGRGQIWAQTAAVARAFPLIGAGLGTFPSVFPAFRTVGEGRYLDHAHSDYLELAAEVGATGLFIVLAGGLFALLPLVRRAPDSESHSHIGYATLTAVAALSIHSLTDFNLAIPSNALTLAALLGLTLRWARPPALVFAAPPDRRPRLSYWGAAPAVLLIGGAISAMVPAIAGGEGGAELAFRDAARSAAPAIADLKALLSVHGDEQGYSPETGRYLEGRIRGAIAAQADGLRRQPLSSHAHLMMARLIMARCAAASLASKEPPDCQHAWMGELRATLALAPMNRATTVEVGRLLSAAWPILDAANRAEAAPIIERTQALNAANPEFRGDVAALGEAR